MCEFFSFRTDGAGKPMYLNAEQRKAVLAKGESPDSHTFIAQYYGFRGVDDDMLNAYEYNPLTRDFKVDRMPNKDDSKAAKAWVTALDFKTIVPELVIKPIIHPFLLPKTEATERGVELLKKWASVWASVRASVWDSVRESVRAYIGSFFNLDKWLYVDHAAGVYPFQPCVDLWERGIVPSYDGKVWRLHSGEKADVIWEGML